MITYKGIDYPTRDLTILMNGEAQDITVAHESLQKAMTIEAIETDGTMENLIDENIYFYIHHEMFLQSDAELAANLDEPFVLAGEIVPPPHIEGERQVTVIFGVIEFDDNTCTIHSESQRVLVDLDLAEDFAERIISFHNERNLDYLIPELYTGTIL